jgi:enamine deaminase RidA (YjgF/YER057c/UK114 family)
MNAMDDSIEARLARMGVTLPSPAAPAANYAPVMAGDRALYVSGQLPMGPQGLSCRGLVGAEVSLDQAREAARLCAVNILAQAKAALGGDLERLRQVLRITVFVASADGFTDQHLVANGASDFLAEALGERGRHARAAVGAAALPLGAAVEIDAIIAFAGPAA